MLTTVYDPVVYFKFPDHRSGEACAGVFWFQELHQKHCISSFRWGEGHAELEEI